ncbi:hypothetical protein K4R76_03505 [Staphylococcus epidermidis]|nr:hypothetical protein [Staphylococcus epidermidis]
MYKQYFKKFNGEPFLFDDKSDEVTDEFTDIIPDEGLYEPIHFDGNKWIGNTKENWENSQPKNESEGLTNKYDEKDDIIAGLSLELLKTQEDLQSTQKDLANLTVQIMEVGFNA